MILMKEVSQKVLKEDNYMIYIHTPFCATCHIANFFLRQIEAAHDQHFFYSMNASLYPGFMQEEKIESVPCLLIKKENEIKEKIYTFHSVPHIYTYLIKYRTDLLISH